MQSVCICSCIGVAHYSHSSCFGHSSSDARELLRIAKQIRMAWNILKNLKKQRKSDSVPLLEDARSIWKYLEFLQQQVRDPCIQEQKANNLSQGSTCKFKLKHPKTASLTSWCFVSRVFSEAQCKPCPHIPRIKETIRTDGWISDVLKEKQLSSNINLPMYTVYLRKYTQLYTYMQDHMCKNWWIASHGSSNIFKISWLTCTLMLLRFRKYWHLVKPAFHVTNCGWKTSYLPWHRIHW